ncbi:vitamin B12 transporter BtuB [bacterium BMS3Abin03]|nr:vitamin B12 transporter BtuB [bacterium BMS3Abin03]
MGKLYKFFVFAVLLLSTTLYAQKYTISGVVTDASTGDKLVGANVYIPDEFIGAATNENGEYSISVDAGTYKITCSYIGFDKIEKTIDVKSDITLNFAMKEYQFTLSVTVIADRVKERETPVAFSNVDKKEMEFTLGSRDIPLVMNITPSVYATNQGGGSGDARINVRGFDQRNFAVMINGIPVNDMENGWVYWSNWDGLGDATSSIQMQRGLSAVNLAVPSIGGTMNIITDPTKFKAGAFFKSEFGTGDFRKMTLFGHTGLIGKFAMSFGGVRKVGQGHADKTWTDAWSYYLGMAYQINDKNRLELYAIGSPQRHGQRMYRLNTATFSHELARDLGFPEAALKDRKLKEQGLLYNSNWSPASTSYQGLQWERSYWNNSINQRYNATFLQERQNYFHKPLVNLNWYSQLSDKFSLYSTIYWSGGQGGGSGTFGKMKYDYSLMQRVVDWDATISNNRGNEILDDPLGTGDSTMYVISTNRKDDPVYGRGGILRNSVNSQWTVGAIAKAYYKVSKYLNTSFGLDWRKAKIDHYREVRDLLGNDYYNFNGNDFESGSQYYKTLGDKIDYFKTNTIDWLGGYLQAEYTRDKFTFYGMSGYSVIKYTFTDHFKLDPTKGGEKYIETDQIGGYQFKGGASFRVTNLIQLYVNGGYVSKNPIFDQVINDRTGTLVENPVNEKFASFELGAYTVLIKNKLTFNLSGYYTNWTDRAQTIGVINADGTDGLVRLDGISSRHMGIEFETRYQPVKFIRFTLNGSFGNWVYTKDISGSYIIDFGTGEEIEYNYYLNNLKVGDAPQTQVVLGLTVYPIHGMQAGIVWRFYSNYFSQFDPFSRNDPEDRAQVWKVPSYNLVDFNFAYDIPGQVLGMRATLFAHIFNLTNALYVQDAVDNSSYNAWTGDGKNHKADDAEIFPGLPTAFNLGFSIGI